jgi:UDP-N-acetylmuramoyl-tripeptide--D-alanyl-D-alanine ligase
MATAIPNNECRFTGEELVRATGGRIVAKGTGTFSIRGVSTDSRTIAAGALFVAIKGPARDGHAYLGAAMRRGAVAAIVERGRSAPSIRCVEVDDTLAALGDLARFHLERERAARALPSIAIVGSAGKTTTKELLAALAGALFGPVLATPGNLNNRLGVPMTLFTLTREHRAMVIECGTNLPGEVARLGAVLEPAAALVLNVDVEHSEGLGTIDQIADEETSILRFTSRTAIVPGEDSRIMTRIPAGLRKITFGESAAADVRLAGRSVVSPGRSRISIEVAPTLVRTGANRIEADFCLLGVQSALNAAAAVAGAAGLWGEPFGAVELERVGAALAAVRPVPGRLSTAAARGVFVIDDSYNSNPRSARAALESAAEVSRDLRARLVIAMGDMLELGALSAEAHASLLREVGRVAPAMFVAVGSEIGAACRSASARGDAFAASAKLAADSEEAARLIRRAVRPGDVLLIKGSRGMAMERIIDALRAEQEGD